MTTSAHRLRSLLLVRMKAILARDLRTGSSKQVRSLLRRRTSTQQPEQASKRVTRQASGWTHVQGVCTHSHVRKLEPKNPRASKSHASAWRHHDADARRLLWCGPHQVVHVEVGRNLVFMGITRNISYKSEKRTPDLPIVDSSPFLQCENKQDGRYYIQVSPHFFKLPLQNEFVRMPLDTMLRTHAFSRWLLRERLWLATQQRQRLAYWSANMLLIMQVAALPPSGGGGGGEKFVCFG